MPDAFPRFAVKAVMSLPTPVLRLLSGGGVVYRGGRTLDPHFQFLTAAAAHLPAIHSLSAAQGRAASAQGLKGVAGKRESGVKVEDFSITGPDGNDLAMRAYRPAGQDPNAPVMVFAHFGGGVIGDLDTCDAFCTIIAKVARCAVVSVDYRLAPEHKWPAGLNDVIHAYRWTREHATRFGAPEGKVAIGGDSMGGNFSAILAQEMKRAGEPQPAVQLLIYPAVDVSSETQSMLTYADSYPLSRPIMDWFMGHYMGPEADPADLRLSPIKESDLTGLAPAIVVTAGFDPLVDQGECYAKRLKDAGVPVVYRCYDGLAHGFTAFTGAVPAADVACREIAGFVRQAYDGMLT